MRPIKDFFIEEYWDIAYREYDKTIFEEKKFKDYKRIKASTRYWYADPMLFEFKKSEYLFYEVFDNKTGLGCIGYSVLENGVFTKPKIIIRESFHMSYPYVFESNNEIYMMPETSEDGCIQLYRAIQFPEKWEKYKVISNINNAVDSVLFDKNFVITSIIVDNYKKTTKLCVIDKGSGKVINDSFPESQETRGAGKIFEISNRIIRPAQDCSGGVYGKGIVFYEIKAKGDCYSEEKYDEFSAESIIEDAVSGIHTYALSNNLEVIDCKRKKFNPCIILYILMKKLLRK